MSESYILIVGCGRLGSLLAERLSTDENSIVVIDMDETAFEKLPGTFSGFTVLGDATELSVLEHANIDKADYLFVVTEDDNTNLMIAQVAREIFEVPNVMARVFDPRREALYSEFRIATVCPTKLSAQAFLDGLAKAPTSQPA
ncbi:MAG: TrkA family potassium uptake protein [Chloroflexi bacterium]|nr:TrkA family potassium uptake protein [Chloroflexota bacterium]